MFNCIASCVRVASYSTLLPLILDYPHLLLVPVVGSMHGKIDVYMY